MARAKAFYRWEWSGRRGRRAPERRSLASFRAPFQLYGPVFRAPFEYLARTGMDQRGVLRSPNLKMRSEIPLILGIFLRKYRSKYWRLFIDLVSA